MALTYFNIGDVIVKDSIRELSEYKDPSRKTESPIIVGGMAVQFHARKQPELWRPTADVDLLYLPEINDYKHFSEEIGGAIQSSLRSKGYKVQLKKVKKRPLFEIKVMNVSNGNLKEQFFIHFDKLSPEFTSSTRYISEREAENAEEIEYNGDAVLVKRIEDIIPYKLKRLQKTIKKTPNVSSLELSLYDEADTGNWNQVAKAPLKTWMEYIVQIQNECDATGKKCLSYEYFLSKDLYDLSLLAQVIESDPSKFNLAYFLNSKREVEVIGKHIIG